MRRLLNFKFKINTLFVSILIALVLFSCGKDPTEQAIYEALKNEDYLLAATHCASYKGDKYKSECLESRSRSEEEIIEILSQKKEFPFMKLFIQPEKDNKIRDFLKKDIYMGIKYRIIWNEISEKN